MTPMYDQDGYLLPPPQLRSIAADRQLYRHLGKWCRIPYGHSVALLRDGTIGVAYVQ